MQSEGTLSVPAAPGTERQAMMALTVAVLVVGAWIGVSILGAGEEIAKAIARREKR